MKTTSRPPLVVLVFRQWVRMYTFGLPTEVRDGRREEIEGDLWEHAREDGLVDGPGHNIESQVFSRWVRGIPADVSWLIEQRLQIARTRASSGHGPSVTWPTRAFFGIGVLVTLFYLMLSISVALNLDGGDAPRSNRVIGFMFVGGFVVGALLWRWWRTPGAALMVAAVVPAAVVTVWSIVTPILTIAMVVLGFVAWRRSGA